MDITFYKNDPNEVLTVKSWRDADYCIIDCEDAVELVDAGRWIEAHKRTIADYNVFAAYGEHPYIEVFKAAKNNPNRPAQRGLSLFYEQRNIYLL